jgi:hypothetical protein
VWFKELSAFLNVSAILHYKIVHPNPKLQKNLLCLISQRLQLLKLQALKLYELERHALFLDLIENSSNKYTSLFGTEI